MLNVNTDEWTYGKCLALYLTSVNTYENQLLIIMILMLYYNYI